MIANCCQSKITVRTVLRGRREKLHFFPYPRTASHFTESLAVATFHNQRRCQVPGSSEVVVWLWQKQFLLQFLPPQEYNCFLLLLICRHSTISRFFTYNFAHISLSRPFIKNLFICTICEDSSLVPVLLLIKNSIKTCWRTVEWTKILGLLWHSDWLALAPAQPLERH